MAEERDVSKIMSALMENPKLFDEVSRLIEGRKSDTPPSNDEAESVSAAATPAMAASGLAADADGGRRKLLGALKPYLCERRARAVDTMMTISDILYMMRAR